MSLYRMRPLGRREELIAFELQRAPLPATRPAEDVRATFVLWDPQGRPLQAYPELVLEQAISGRELMARQAEAWERHAARARSLFGTRPLTGPQPPDRPLRGLLVFVGALFCDQGRWHLVHQGGERWRFSCRQVLEGSRLALPPAAAEREP